MPEPMMAPIPNAVSDHGPRVFCSRCPGTSDSEISLSMDLQQNTWWSDVRTVAAGSVGGRDKAVVVSEAPSTEPSALSIWPRFPSRLETSRPNAKCLCAVLPFRLTASQLLYLGLF